MDEDERTHLQDPVLRLGVSTCLLGKRVRFDGGHKLDRYLTGTLGRFFEWVPVCPEVEMGLPIPRESLRQVGQAESPRLIAPKSGTDHTEAMTAWAQKRVEELADIGLHGFVFKKRSPQPPSGAGVGAPAGVPASVPQRAHAAQPRVGPTSVEL